MRLTLNEESAVRDEGTIIVLEGIAEDGKVYRFGADRRPALNIIDALQSGEEIEVEVESWQILGGGR